MIPASRSSWSLAAVVGALCLGLVMACSSKPESNPRYQEASDSVESISVESGIPVLPPQIQSLHLTPLRPQPGELVQALVKVKKSEETALDLDFAWSIGGERVRARSDAVRFPAARKGERIEVRVTATNSHGLTSEAAAFIRVGNQPPSVLGVDLSRRDLSEPGSVLEASVQSHDPDGDELRLIYEWRVNGRRVPGRLSSIETSDLRRGDEIQVVVIADDGDDHSDQTVSRVFRVENSAPRITSTPNNESGSASFFYQVRAKDEDLDRGLIYSLVEAPAGMSIGRLGGELTWSPGPNQAGVHKITLQVEDRHGGSTLQTFELTIRDQDRSQELASARN